MQRKILSIFLTISARTPVCATRAVGIIAMSISMIEVMNVLAMEFLGVIPVLLRFTTFAPVARIDCVGAIPGAAPQVHNHPTICACSVRCLWRHC